MREVSLREANQNFSACIAEVEAGERLILTRRGEPVAEIIPYPDKSKADADARKVAARKRLLALMDAGYDWGGPYTYDERHER